jgi:hypothetical protein
LGVDVDIQIILTSALVAGEWSTSRSSRCTPRERIPCRNFIRGWVDSRICLDDVEKRKFLTLLVLEL